MPRVAGAAGTGRAGGPQGGDGQDEALPKGRDQADEARRVGDEPGGEQERPGEEDHGALHQLERRDLPFRHRGSGAKQGSESLGPHEGRPDHRGEHDEPHGGDRADQGPHLDEQIDLGEGDDEERDEQQAHGRASGTGRGYHFNINCPAVGRGMRPGGRGGGVPVVPRLVGRGREQFRTARFGGPGRYDRMNVQGCLRFGFALAAACLLAVGLPWSAAEAEGVARTSPASDSGAVLRSGAQGAVPVGLADLRTALPGSRTPAGGSSSASEDPSGSDPAGFLRELLEAGEDEPEFLHPDAAFRVEASAHGRDLAVVRWRIEPGYYLYAKRIEVHLPDGSPSDTEIADVALPRGEFQEDPYFGLVEVYRHEAAASVRLAHAGPPPPVVTLDVIYQGCADAGLCYPPIRKAVAARLDGGARGNTATGTPAGTGAGEGAGAGTGAGSDATAIIGVASRPDADAASLSETDRIARRLATEHVAASVALFFGFGLLLSLTPCIFPMIPILSSILVRGGGRTGGGSRGFALSLAYVAGSALAWAGIGAVAGLLGANVQIALQNPWALGAVSAAFVALALSMFGLFRFELPSAWVTRATTWTSRAGQGRGYAGAAAMGVVSALIVGPCVAAPMAGAVLYIGQAGDAARGSLALAAMGFGMGVPLLVLGASSQRLLPRAGAWMKTMERAAGVVLLAVAAYLLERVLPPGAAMLGWAAVAACAGLVLARGAWPGRPAARERGGGARVAAAGGAVAAAAYAGLLVVGASTGAHDPLRPLAGLAAPAGPVVGVPHLEFTAIKGTEGPSGLDAALARAEATGRFVMLDFYADWCVSCKEMEDRTFRDPRVLAALGKVRLLRADVTANDAADQALMRRVGIFGPPAILFFGPDRVERRRYRTVGFKDAEDFTKRVAGATGAA